MTGNNRRTDLLTREFQELPFATLQQISKELQTNLNEIIAEPLPAEIQALLEKLEQKLDISAGCGGGRHRQWPRRT